ncbi:MAG: Snf7 family protein [Candidatus Bathyarchaeia archaeon]
MGNRFIDRWKKKEEQPSLVSKVKNVVKPQENLKAQITLVIQRIDVQTRTLDSAVQRFQNRDADIFGRVVKAFSERDEARAHILATELSEIRKIEKMLTTASLAMQSVSMRLNTVQEMGDIVSVLSPAKNVINSIRSGMCDIMPEASAELGNIGNLLGDIVGSTCQTADIQLNTARIDPETEAILKEAEVATERKLKQQLPEVAPDYTGKRLSSIEA